MKKFFYILMLCFFATTAHAQVNPQMLSKDNIRVLFPNYTLEYVAKNTEIISVTEKYQRKHTETYQYFTNNGSQIGKLLVGDTVLAFKGQAYASLVNGCYMAPQTKQSFDDGVVVVENKHKKTRRKKDPARAERTMQYIQLGLQYVVPAAVAIGTSRNYQVNLGTLNGSTY